MNLLKVFRSIQSFSWLPMRITFGSRRWQTTDIPSKEQPDVDVSTNVKPVTQSNLMEFFDTSPNIYESKIIHGE